MKYLVTGGAGFIGSHLVDRLVAEGHEVTVLDSLLSGNKKYVSERATFVQADITKYEEVLPHVKDVDGIFHLAAIARTPWCIEDPMLAYQTNVMGTLHILEAARHHSIRRVVMTSSNVVYAFYTPYRTSKEALEQLGRTYVDMYGLSVMCLRNSNVYGTRQSEKGPSPNVFSALRKSKRENGFVTITGDGEQTRDFTHVSDIVAGHIAAMGSKATGVVDLCTGVNHSLNKIAAYFECPVYYSPERPGDVKHIVQSSREAFDVLGWKAVVPLEVGIHDFLKDDTFE